MGISETGCFYNSLEPTWAATAESRSVPYRREERLGMLTRFWKDAPVGGGRRADWRSCGKMGRKTGVGEAIGSMGWNNKDDSSGYI